LKIEAKRAGLVHARTFDTRIFDGINSGFIQDGLLGGL
jgi:hypothetical protein